MDKLDFIARQLSKAARKKYEHYVATRIFHRLDDLDLKFITQQYVSRPDGVALTDIFFPQIKLHIEVDEQYHLSQEEQDNLRAADIINATGHRIERIPINTIEEVNSCVLTIVELIQQLKVGCVDFVSWNIDAEMNPQTYIDKGFIDIDSDCAFHTMVDAANCFGQKIKPKGIWKGALITLKNQINAYGFQSFMKMVSGETAYPMMRTKYGKAQRKTVRCILIRLLMTIEKGLYLHMLRGH